LSRELISTTFPYTTLFRSQGFEECEEAVLSRNDAATPYVNLVCFHRQNTAPPKNLWPDLLDPFMRPASAISWSRLANGRKGQARDRKSTRLNSSHEWISYA